MMRTFWLATICLAVLSALAVGKAVRTIIAERLTDQTTVGTGLAQDALTSKQTGTNKRAKRSTAKRG
jgi:hypothetical protein